MQKIFAIEARGQRVLTSAQIAECYGTTVDCIKQNFHANKTRFVEGKHYIALVGSELKDFKNKVRIPHSVENSTGNEVRITHSAEIKAKYQFDTQFKYAKCLYLWTEKGALLHAKSLNTDKAWEVYDYLVDFYFRAKEKQKPAQKMIPQTPRQTGTDIAPMFCDFIAKLPIEALDAMERAFRENESKAVRMAALSILAEKMKRQIM